MMYTYAVPSERQIDVNESLKNITDCLKEYNIHSSVKTSQNGLVASVDLSNNKGEYLTTGVGKGPWSVVGAYYKALEQILLQYQFISSDTSVQSLRHWLLSEERHCACLFGNILTEYDDGPLKYSRYYSLTNTHTYLIPEVLVNPYHAEPLIKTDAFQFLKTYSSSSGWASGSTFEEAILHGANELVEKHHMSELYKQYISHSQYTGSFYRVSIPLAILEKNPLSTIDLDQVTVIMSATELGSYFCACTLESDISPMTLRSSGVSYSKYHAIERAWFELVQTVEFFSPIKHEKDTQSANFLNSVEKLSRLVKFSHFSDLPIRDLTALRPDLHSFYYHYKKLNLAINETRSSLLFRTAFQTKNIWFVSVYIPGLERFNIIDTGKWVIPLR
ncbi:YcaO-like family protein [Vibrio kyushuensis]|uniref:YcaO-like family protein n=1 Tax=Vibrio kyushuensis TaxID=2910249 RepID=UPI003D0B4282